ncbi:PLP-dependent aminotransferase family protein [Deinococcus sp. KNUC1210]|uniref:MocR-like pyridoxine biosynthesis transcription factor PdxR n=1 Tax=Deinococcus sp. KNUC1210 TaxID=2917691 RepID=UPI001EF0E023|nr:PLP-dependent aminotransferase family protein [Deinococcus sp. KNUC1210]ULH16097.1 PLP-dependent aminotransferase family protein [Deinococcus sp. KNUC1210]
MLLPPLLPARSGEAQHQRAARTLREAMQRGELLPGVRLSTRALAQRWGLARATVQDAIDQLAAEGAVDVRARSGSYVAAHEDAGQLSSRDVGPFTDWVPLSNWALRALEGQQAEQRGPAPAIDFRLGQSAGLFPSQMWAESLARRAARSMDEDAGGELLSASALGPLSTRQAIAHWLTRERGADVTPDMVMLTAGTQSALDLLARTYLEPGRTAVLEDPGYPGARRAFGAVGAALRSVPVDQEGLVTAALPQTASLVYVTPGCQFPTTATLSARRRSALLAWAAHARAFIVEDDYAADFHHAARPPAPLQGQAPSQVVLLGTFSQSLAPALRSGYLVAPASVLDTLSRTRPLTDLHPPTLDALALADFLASGGYARHLRRARVRLAHRHDVLLNALEAAHLHPRPARAGSHLLLGLPGGLDETAVQARAAELGVGVARLSDYLLNVGAPHAPALLLAFAHLSPEQLREGAALLGRAISESGK